MGRDFHWFWTARMVSAVGSAITAVAFPVLIYDLTGSASLTSTVTALHVAPYLVFGLVAGAVADRLPRRRVMIVAHIVAAITLLSVPLAGLAGTLHVVQVLAVATVVSSAFVWFDAAAFGALPAIVGKDQVARANSALWTASTLFGIGGPAFGGLLVALSGPANAVAVDAACYITAVTCLLMVVRPMGPTTARLPRRSPTVQLRADIAEGIHYVMRHPVIRPLTIVGASNSIAAGGVTGLLLVLAVEQLGTTSRGTEFGLLLAIMALGGFVAAALLPTLTARTPIGWITLGGLGLCVPTVLILSISSSTAAASVCLLLWSAGNTVVILNGINLRQQLTPDHLQARVNTTGRLVAWGGTPLGAVSCGLLAQATTVSFAVAATSLALMAGAMYGWITGMADQQFGTAPAT